MKKVTKLTYLQKEELKLFIKKGKHSGKEVQRAQAILLVDKGLFAEIPDVTGVSRKHAFTLRSLYRVQGSIVLLDQAKGKPKELLTRAQRLEITEILKSKLPEEFGYGKQPGWTTAMLGAVIEKQYQVKYKSKTSLYLLFKQVKFSYHCPGKKYHKRSELAVGEWADTILPKLQTAWSDPSALIFCEDEMSLSSQTTTQKIWLPQNSYPKIEVACTKKSTSIYGFLNLKEGIVHAHVTDWQNMYITVEQLTSLRANYPEKHFLIIWDQAGWHRGSKVQDWIREDGNTETIYFPVSAPEENPQEHVWKAGRAAITHNQYIPKVEEAAVNLTNYLNSTSFPYELLGFKKDTLLDAVS